MSDVNPVHQRLAELWMLQKVRQLTEDEQTEMITCLDWNMNYCWKYALLANYSVMADMTNDFNWQHDICGELDKW